mmetsp:Transcript_13587/g.31858  ORF Transcript_13587/g.31858 Transcript_13587/m.31858 type:complete len:633 (+) Transcript_13587:155-2053(+)
MSVSGRLSNLEERLFDEYSLGSMQPSDEWEDDRQSINDTKIGENSSSFEYVNKQSYSPEESASQYKNESKEYFFPIVEYFASLVPTFSVDATKELNAHSSYSTATYSRVDVAKPKMRSSRSNSRYVIENTESIERRDEDRQLNGRRGRDDEDCTRDQSSMSSYVEEISQISEITMDIPTVVPEERFPESSGLPTISESKQFEAPLETTCNSGIVRTKARCSAGTDTTANKSEGNNDFIDFVFELVEDALCKPIKTSKSERKKVFMEAFHEESEKAFKIANRNGSNEISRETSKHSRSSRSGGSTKRSTDRSKSASPAPRDRDGSIGEQAEPSTHSSRRSGHSRMKLVDKPPLNSPLGSNSAFPLDEELTMDWSKMMSLAEKQLEAGIKSATSVDSRMSEASKISEKSSVYQSVMCDHLERGDASIGFKKKILKKSVFEDIEKKRSAINQSSAKSSVASTASLSSSTHAALVDEIAKDLKESTHARLADDVVRDLRELSALDSSSFEEESRFLLTSTLFHFMGNLIPTFIGKDEENFEYEVEEERVFDEKVFDEISEIMSMGSEEFICPTENPQSEESALKLIRYIAFAYVFIFWPQGIARRFVPNRPLRVFKKKQAENKPTSLLQLVNQETR